MTPQLVWAKVTTSLWT